MPTRRTCMAFILGILLMTAVPPAIAKDGRLKVVTTFTVLQDMAQNVAGEDADVVSITKPGAEIHDYQPTPQDIVRASNADLIMNNGLNLERWFHQFMAHLGNIPAVLLSEGVEPIAIGDGEYEGDPNPHAWMGMNNAMIYVNNIRDALVKYDPEHADHYRANAQTYRERIRSTLQPMRDRISRISERRRWLVSCEGAFSYLARDFRMKELYLWPINAEQTGTPQQVRKVVDGVRTSDIPVVFCESTVNTKPAEQVARETGARYGGVLYVDSLSRPDGPVPTYLELLKVDAQTIAAGLDGQQE